MMRMNSIFDNRTSGIFILMIPSHIRWLIKNMSIRRLL